MEAVKAQHVKKGKKKQANDELDRMKQAEKKRRRLEKALATSAAIRSELEKKKQKKKEEQQRLDEEGAALAEAVALQVLIGDDSDDSSEIAVKKDEEFNPSWYCAASDLDLFMDSSSRLKSVHSHEDLRKFSLQSIGWIPRGFSYDSRPNYLVDSDSSSPSSSLERSFHWQGMEHVGRQHTDVSADTEQVDTVFFTGF
ncbi:hypothetical protein Dimus_000226 [Dionaea muscipula]